LCEHDHASWLWARLRAAFPRVYAALLMPDHPHLLAVVDDVAATHDLFVRILSHFSRRLEGPRPRWQPIPSSSRAPTSFDGKSALEWSPIR
jgi:hypothetical protein